MRKRFEQQYSVDTLKIEDTKILLKSRDAFSKLLLSLKEIYTNEKYNEMMFKILEDKIIKGKKKTGRKGMNLWQIFVLAQTRLALNISYDNLADLVNNHYNLRQILGINSVATFDSIKISYQNIVDNVKLLDDETVKELNKIIVEMGHDVFKKKETEALDLKTDSFVVLSNVHFPTDYNLLWDSARKVLDLIPELVKKYDLPAWRKRAEWYKELKKKVREIGLSSKKKLETRKLIVKSYLNKARLLSEKIKESKEILLLRDDIKPSLLVDLEYYISMLDKHIDLLERRIIKGEIIPHEEKIFSIFETYTEWINKGKTNPNFELGKNLQVTTDQFHLIVDHEIMNKTKDSIALIQIADRVLLQYQVDKWSFDKGYFSKENKELLSLFVPNVVMPKKGKLNKNEYQEEHQKEFKKYRNKHSAVESNINELSYRGLDRCPDSGRTHFNNYVALGISAYNLHKIGAELLKQGRIKERLKKAA